jgi:hypothetical protein
MEKKPGVHAVGRQHAAAVVSSVGVAVDIEAVRVACPPFGTQRILELELIAVDMLLVVVALVALKFPNEVL